MKTQRQHFFLLLITVLLLGSCDTFKPLGKSSSSSSSSKGKTQSSYSDRYKTSDKSDKTTTTGSRTTTSKTKPAAKTKTDPYADIDRSSWDDETDIYGDATERVKTSGKKTQSRVNDATEDAGSRASSAKKKKESQFDELTSDNKKRRASDFDYSDPDEENGDDGDNFEYDKDVFNSLNTKVRDAEDDPYADEEEDAAESLPLIFFEKFSDKLDRTALNALSIVYDYMKENPSVSLSVLGEASEFAQNESNSKLAFKRANAVVETLHKWGIASNRLFVPENYSTMQRETKDVEEHYFAMFYDGEVDDYDWSNDLARKRRSQSQPDNSDEDSADEDVTPISRDDEEDNDADTDGTRHKVVKGDTLHNLAVRYQTSVARIKKRNGLKSDTIKIGQVLVID